MMAKERLVEQYGEIRYTIGTGCSGGSIAQHTIANAYPGIYQGLVTTCSYPDTLTAGAQFADYHLMRLYFEDPSRWGAGVAWTPTQMAQVEGHASHVNAVVADEGLFKSALNPENDCSGTKDTGAGRREHALRLRDQPGRGALLGARHHDQPARAASRERVERGGAGGRPRVRRHPVRQHRRPVRARGAAAGPDHARPVRRPQRQDRRARRQLRPRRRSGSPATRPRSSAPTAPA